MALPRVMDSLWQARGQDLKMTVYNVVPTEQDQAGGPHHHQETLLSRASSSLCPGP